MDLSRVRDLLAVLREAGVKSADLNGKGQLVSVELYPPQPAPGAQVVPAVSAEPTPEDRALQHLITLSQRGS